MAILLIGLLVESGNELPKAEVPPAVTDLGREQIVQAIETGIESTINASPELKITEKEQLVKARRGQGQFRQNVQALEKCCRISGINDPQFLIASHIKPWRVATNEERLDGENGLLLSPNVDFLFDRGFISFDDKGTLLVSPVADKECLRRMGIPIEGATTSGAFSTKQLTFLAFHRRNVFLEAGRED
jgi:predicted restriction endonuclease